MSILCILGQSGSGKTTICEILDKEYGIKRHVTDTTRQPREGEIDGEDYNFVSLKDYSDRMNAGGYILPGHTNGNQYGLRTTSLDEDKVLIVDPQGFRELTKTHNTVGLYVKLPTNIMFDRLKNRGDSSGDVRVRLKEDAKRFKGLENETIVVTSEKEAIEEVLKVLNI